MRLRWVRWFRVTVSGGVLLLLALVLQGVMGSEVVRWSGAVVTTVWTVGMPVCAEVEWTEAAVGGGGAALSAVRVHWVMLGVVLLGSYGVCMGVGRLLEYEVFGRRVRRRGRWEWTAGRVLVLLVVMVAAVAAIAAAGVSRAEWGYWFRRPGVDRRVLNAREMVTVSAVQTRQVGGRRIFVPDEGLPGLGPMTMEARYAHGVEDPYYCLDQRALVATEGRLHGLRAPAMAASRLEPLYELAAKTGRIEAGAAGYARAWELSGLVYELAGEKEYLLIAVKSEEVSNDHHAFYELLFEKDEAGGWREAGGERFYYDVAGMEGAEFWVLAMGFSVMGLMVVLPVAVVVLGVRKVAEWRRARRVGFMVEV